MKLLIRWSLGAWAIAVAGVTLLAQQPPGGFVPMDELPAAEQLPAAPLVITAYAFVWVALLFYVWSVWRRLVRVEGELASLEQRVKK